MILAVLLSLLTLGAGAVGFVLWLSARQLSDDLDGICQCGRPRIYPDDEGTDDG